MDNQRRALNPAKIGTAIERQQSVYPLGHNLWVAKAGRGALFLLIGGLRVGRNPFGRQHTQCLSAGIGQGPTLLKQQFSLRECLLKVMVGASPR